MSARLERIADCPQRAEQSNWSPRALARCCRVSLRSLERHIQEARKQTVRCWLHQERMSRARELVLEGFTVKEIAAKLGYAHAQHFSRDFKKHFGCCPCKVGPNLPDSAFDPAQGTDCRILV